MLRRRLPVVSDGLRQADRAEEPADPEAEAAAFARWNEGLALFGLAPADYDPGRARGDVLAEIAAVYSARTKQVFALPRLNGRKRRGG